MENEVDIPRCKSYKYLWTCEQCI